MSLVHNERTKLTANTFNGVAIASMVAGFVTPLAAASFGVSGPGANGGLVTALVSIVWLTVGIALHMIARVYLGRLEEP